MAIIFDRKTFMEETGHILDWFEVKRLGIPPISVCCFYDHPELPMLQAFCEEYPNYHVISAMSRYVMFNRYDPDALFFLIGKGNSDSTIVCVHNDRREISLEDAIKLARG